MSTNEDLERQNRDCPMALSLFSGAGGMDLGVARAGFRILAHVEKDPHCCNTLRENDRLLGGNIQVIEEDIQTIDPLKLMTAFGLRSGELDLLFGGPPCQPFSQIGKQKGLEDERGLLIFQVSRFANIFKPKAIFVEQVPGFATAKDTKGRRGGVLDMFLRNLSDLGYTTKWKILNAADYAVPQLRRRVFIIASLGKNGLMFPSPTHTPPSSGGALLRLKPYETVGRAIKGLSAPVRKGETPYIANHVDVTPKGDIYRIHGVPEGSYLAAQHHLPAKQIGGLTAKDTTKFLRTSRSEPSKTLRGGETFYHPVEDRYLTPRECMKIHTFPDEYILCGPIRSRTGRVKDLDQHRQVANAVPPLLAEILATAIRRTVLCPSSSKSLDTP